MSHAELRIGALAELAGVSTRLIRHYHHIGLLAEPERSPNGYRVYRVEDVVGLLRVRQLAEMGLSLDEVRDAIGADSGELRDILVHLDCDLAERQAHLARRRAVISAALRRVDDPDSTNQKASVLAELERIAGDRHPGSATERLVADLLDVSVDPSSASAMWTAYADVLADETASRGLLEATRRLGELDELDPADHRVDALAGEIAEAGAAVRDIVTDGIGDIEGDPALADRLLRTIQAGMGPAQGRCMALVFEKWSLLA